MDIFCECIVRHKKTPVDYLIIGGMAFAGIVISLILLLISHLTFGLFPILIFLLWYGVYLVARTRFAEFEYALTNNELDIDKIIAKAKRKSMLCVDIKQIELCASADDSEYAHIYNNTAAIQKKYDFTGYGNKLYFIDFTTEARKTRILFNPSDELLENLRIINPSKVHIS